ncbi:hypothetical protein [Maribacter thermophilus]|uniref:hypothetical protein n=1 Tax=Maribacter thermophilus TaxID=1197874 RepID=UPI0006410870|nr:hypothetical protein [Maribacter thermophilus]
MVSRTNKRKAKKKIFIESLLVFFIAISPFLYKVYEYIPLNEEGISTFLGIEISPQGFEDASVYIWFLASKIIPLYLLIIWFLTSRDWWYHIILIPVAMYAFQLFEVVFDSDDNIDTENIWWIIPICMITIPFVYLIRLKLYDKHVHGIDLEAMEQELNQLKTETSENKKEESLKKNDVTETQEHDSKQGNLQFSYNRIEQILKQLQTRLQGLLNIR